MSYHIIKRNKIINNKTNKNKIKDHNIINESYNNVNNNDINIESYDDIYKNLIDSILTEDYLIQLTGIKNLNELKFISLKINTSSLSIYNLHDLLPNLQALSLDNSKIVSIRDLGSGLHNLMSLSLMNCGLHDLDGIGVLVGLQDLNVEDNYLVDFSPLAMHENIQRLNASGNNITDLSVVDTLTTCSNLNSLSLARNPITKAPNYRLVIASLIITLTKLDGIPVDPLANQKVSNSMILQVSLTMQKYLENNRKDDILESNPIDRYSSKSNSERLDSLPDTGSELTHGNTVVYAGSIASSIRQRRIATSTDSNTIDTLNSAKKLTDKTAKESIYFNDGDITEQILGTDYYNNILRPTTSRQNSRDQRLDSRENSREKKSVINNQNQSNKYQSTVQIDFNSLKAVLDQKSNDSNDMINNNNYDSDDSCSDVSSNSDNNIHINTLHRDKSKRTSAFTRPSSSRQSYRSNSSHNTSRKDSYNNSNINPFGFDLVGRLAAIEKWVDDIHPDSDSEEAETSQIIKPKIINDEKLFIKSTDKIITTSNTPIRNTSLSVPEHNSPQDNKDNNITNVIDSLDTMSLSSNVKSIKGEGVLLSDHELIQLLQKPPKAVKQLRTKSNFINFFYGIDSIRMNRLLEEAYSNLYNNPIEIQNKVLKRLELLHDVMN